MDLWRNEFKVDPVPPLLNMENDALNYFTKRDLLVQDLESIEILWNSSPAKKIINKQQEDGSWKYSGGQKDIRSEENYNQLETFRILGELVEKFGFNRDHDSIEKAAQFLFQFQTGEGDFRGIYGHQYATTYSPAIMELLIKAGYEKDTHILKGFNWLLSIRQDDGGWAIPFRTVGKNIKEALNSPHPIEPDKTKPFSHLVTAMVLRAFAAHPEYRKSGEARKAGSLVISRFFKNDKYADRKDKSYWERVGFPFWFTDIITALDSLYYLGFTAENEQIKKALDFLKEKQNDDGTFDLKITRGRDKDLPYWICLAVCRLFKRYYE